MSAVKAIPQSKPDARERILDTAYQLFSRRAVRDVGVDEVIERAGVAKATLYPRQPGFSGRARAGSSSHPYSGPSAYSR